MSNFLLISPPNLYKPCAIFPEYLHGLSFHDHQFKCSASFSRLSLVTCCLLQGISDLDGHGRYESPCGVELLAALSQISVYQKDNTADQPRSSTTIYWYQTALTAYLEYLDFLLSPFATSLSGAQMPVNDGLPHFVASLPLVTLVRAVFRCTCA